MELKNKILFLISFFSFVFLWSFWTPVWTKQFLGWYWPTNVDTCQSLLNQLTCQRERESNTIANTDCITISHINQWSVLQLASSAFNILWIDKIGEFLKRSVLAWNTLYFSADLIFIWWAFEAKGNKSLNRTSAILDFVNFRDKLFRRLSKVSNWRLCNALVYPHVKMLILKWIALRAIWHETDDKR